VSYMKDIANFADYGLTLVEATGHRYFSPVEKYSVTGSKFLLSVSQNGDAINVAKEVGQAGISVLCDIGGHVTGNKRATAQLELFGKIVLDIAAAMATADERNVR